MNSAGVTTDNYDGGKGLELIPVERVEVIFNLPPYLSHNTPGVHDGFGDVAFLVKIVCCPQTRNRRITFSPHSWAGGCPADRTKTAVHPVITPTIAYGKGFGHFDAQGTFGVGLPTADTNLLGRTYAWNNVFQYRVLRKFWPEVELTSSFFQDGKNDGNK